MNFLSVFVNLVRAALAGLSVYHLCRREYKLILSTGAVLALTFLPGFVENMFHVRLDTLGSLLYIVVLVMAIYLGSALKFYDRYRWWDMLIHFLSGIASVSLGIAILRNLEGMRRFPVLFFSFTFSLSLHVIWEVLEYAADSLFHTDHQRWQRVNATINHKSESAIQPAGLVDTMNDTIVCMIGTAASCTAWWFIL